MLKGLSSISQFNPAAPGPIGGTTPSSGAFTTLSASGLIDATKASATQIRASGWDAVSGAGTDRGSITLGSNAGYYGQFNYANTGSFYVDNAYDNAAAAINFRLRTSGTPVTALSLSGAGVLTAATLGATSTWVAGDKYVVIDSSGVFHRSAIGPAS